MLKLLKCNTHTPIYMHTHTHTHTNIHLLMQMKTLLNFSLVQFSRSVESDCLQPHGLQHASLPCPTNSRSLLRLMSTESVMPSKHLIFCCPLLLLPLVFSSIRVFSNELALHMRWPKYWSFSFCHQSFQ